MGGPFFNVVYLFLGFLHYRFNVRPQFHLMLNGDVVQVGGDAKPSNSPSVTDNLIAIFQRPIIMESCGKS